LAGIAWRAHQRPSLWNRSAASLAW
jgi:hypothetical protein